MQSSLRAACVLPHTCHVTLVVKRSWSCKQFCIPVQMAKQRSNREQHGIYYSVFVCTSTPRSEVSCSLLSQITSKPAWTHKRMKNSRSICKVCLLQQNKRRSTETLSNPSRTEQFILDYILAVERASSNLHNQCSLFEEHLSPAGAFQSVSNFSIPHSEHFVSKWQPAESHWFASLPLDRSTVGILLWKWNTAWQILSALLLKLLFM